jgi:hypothetical protein
VRQRTITFSTSDVVLVDRPSEHIGFTRTLWKVAIFFEPFGIEFPRSVLGRCLVVRQFESRRLRSVTVILIKFPARTPASCATLEVGPAWPHAAKRWALVRSPLSPQLSATNKNVQAGGLPDNDCTTRCHTVDAPLALHVDALIQTEAARARSGSGTGASLNRLACPCTEHSGKGDGHLGGSLSPTAEPAKIAPCYGSLHLP